MGSTSAVMTMNSQIPRLRVLVASLALGVSGMATSKKPLLDDNMLYDSCTGMTQVRIGWKDGLRGTYPFFSCL